MNSENGIRSDYMINLLPEIEKELSAGRSVCIFPKGTSMLPMISGGRDSLIISAVCGPLKKNDLPLYRRDDGKFVIHRIVGTKNGEYTMSGDNQTSLEKGIRQDQLIGVVTAFTRKGKEYGVTASGYRLYCAVLPAYKIIRQCFRIMKRIPKAVMRRLKKLFHSQ